MSCEESIGLSLDHQKGFNSGLTEKPLLRQSFDRFDQKLSEIILSFLTFNQKVLFESVSKLWKRCIYNRQKRLHIMNTNVEEKDLLSKILVPIEVTDYTTGAAAHTGMQRIDRLSLNLLLQKCNSLEEVVLNCFVQFEDLDIICKNCPKIKSIEFETCGLSANDLDSLGKTYGHNFETFNLSFSHLSMASSYLNKLLIHCKNLKELVSPNICHLFLEDSDYLPKLESVDTYQIFSSDEETNNFERFDKFCAKFTNLSKLKVHIHCMMNSKRIEHFLFSLSKLKNLTQLNFYGQEIHGISQLIAGLSKAVPGLKYFRSALFIRGMTIDQIITPFEGFNNLVKLDLYIRGWNENPSFSGRVESLKSSKNLKYFKIGAGSIAEDFFDDIGTHLPNLSTFILRTESEITDKTIKELSNLKKLKEFIFNKHKSFNQYITDESVCDLINKCPTLERLYFGSRPNISHKTIEALICCAKHSKRNIHFECRESEIDGQQIPAMDLSKFVDLMPPNLTIIIL